MVPWSACKKPVFKRTTMAALYRRLVKILEWTPISKAVPISAERHYILRQFQDEFYYNSLQYLYSLYTVMSIIILVMFIVKEYFNQWADLSQSVGINVAVLTVSNIFYHPCLFAAAKIKRIRQRMKWLVIILNAISQALLSEMASTYAYLIDLTESRLVEVMEAIFFISVSTFYFQSSYVVSSIAWATIFAGCLVGIFSAENRGSYAEVVSDTFFFFFFLALNFF